MRPPSFFPGLLAVSMLFFSCALAALPVRAAQDCGSYGCFSNPIELAQNTPNPGGGPSTPGAGNGPNTPNPGAGGTTTTITIDNPLAYDSVESLLDGVMGTLRNIVVLLALVMLVIGGLMYILSAGNETQATRAKKTITAALVGLALVLAAPSFLKEVAGVLGWSDLPSQASGAPTLSQIAKNVLNFLLSMAGILAVIMLVIGGIMYLGSAGDEKRMETGRKIVLYSIMGIVVIFASLVLVTQLAKFFAA
jgi:hypothetical protein